MPTNAVMPDALDELDLDDICIAMTHQVRAVNTLLQLLVMECTHVNRPNTASALLYHLSILQPVLNRISLNAHQTAINNLIERQAADADAQEELLIKKEGLDV